MNKIKAAFHWVLAFCIAFCAVNLLCFLYERPVGWFNTPNGPSPWGWYPGTVFVHGTEGYGVTKVDRNGYLNPEGELADGYILMMGSSHTQGKELPSDQKYSVLVNDYLAKDSEMLYTYNISSDGHFLPGLIRYFPAAVEAFPEAGMITIEIGSTDFSESELENALHQVTYDPQDTIVNRVAQMSTTEKLKTAVKGYFPLLSLIKQKMETSDAANSELLPPERDMERYGFFLEQALALIRGQFDGKIVFIFHPAMAFSEEGTAELFYGETWDTFQRICQEQNIDVIDTGPLFMTHYEETKQLPYGFANTTPGSGHLNKVGHRLISQSIIAFMEETE